jgi:putative oligomerization/nucleic acid binding protein
MLEAAGMGDDDSHEATLADAGLSPSIPAMPAVPREELFRGSPYLLMYSDVRHSIGWRDDRKAGPSFVVARIGLLGRITVTERFPLTEQGWADAWQVIAGRDAGAATVIAARLAAREGRGRTSSALAALDAESLCYLRGMTFNGGSGEARLAKETAYDVRFLSDRLMVCPPGVAEPIIEVPYTDVETVEVIGSGQDGNSTGNTLAWMFALGLLGALLGLFILGVAGLLLGAMIFGAVGAAVGANFAKNETTVRIRVKDAELYFLSTAKRADEVRIEMSGGLLAIENAHADHPSGANKPADQAPELVPDRLTQLASLLQQGLITREEFEHLKAKLIAES